MRPKKSRIYKVGDKDVVLMGKKIHGDVGELNKPSKCFYDQIRSASGGMCTEKFTTGTYT